MPLFGKKKDKGKEEKPRGTAYPTQPASAYPVQQRVPPPMAYPGNAAPPPMAYPGNAAPPPMAYPGNAAPPGPYYPPPSYSSVSTAASSQAHPGGYQNYPQSYAGPPPMYSPAGAGAHTPHGAGPYQQANVPTTVVVQNAFDPGARFDVGSKPNIPPPPPGYAPNAAQMASMQGCNVVLGQRSSNWLEGGSSGGVSFF